MKITETPIYKRKLQIEAELKGIEEIYSLMSNAQAVSFEKRQILDKLICDYMKLKSPGVEEVKFNNGFWMNN